MRVSERLTFFLPFVLSQLYIRCNHWDTPILCSQLPDHIIRQNTIFVHIVSIVATNIYSHVLHFFDYLAVGKAFPPFFIINKIIEDTI